MKIGECIYMPLLSDLFFGASYAQISAGKFPWMLQLSKGAKYSKRVNRKFFKISTHEFLNVVDVFLPRKAKICASTVWAVRQHCESMAMGTLWYLLFCG